MNPTAPLTHWVDGRNWTCVDFVSDLHLHAEEPATWRAFQHHLQHTPAQALFILGDLFEVWVGDDVLQAPGAFFERECVEALAQTSQRLALYWMVGNRDFLTGQAFLQAAGMQPLQDPCTLVLQDETCLLGHGDAWCLQDHKYQQFRALVRSQAWQTGFLKQPLSSRLDQAQAMRTESQAHQAAQTVWADVDTEAARAALTQAGASRLIHGHTHRPADHVLAPGLVRTVLSDWCATASPPRTQVLRWQQGWQRFNAETT
jgi:UDP-2,3-diacylglucosamine hydrolase